MSSFEFLLYLNTFFGRNVFIMPNVVIQNRNYEILLDDPSTSEIKITKDQAITTEFLPQYFNDTDILEGFYDLFEKVEYLYINRKMLESCRDLDKWIKVAFNIDCPQRIVQHPLSSPKIGGGMCKQIPCDNVRSCVVSDSLFTLITKDGSLFKLTIESDKIKTNLISKLSEVPDDISEIKYHFITPNDFIQFDPGTVYYDSEMVAHIIMRNKNQTIGISSDNDLVGFLDTDGFISIFDKLDFSLCLMKIETDPNLNKVFTVSKLHQLVVSCTHYYNTQQNAIPNDKTPENNLTNCCQIDYYSLNSKSLLNTAILRNVIVHNIFITPSWSFTLLFCENIENGEFSFKLLNQKGEKIQEKAMSTKILNICVWATKSGFDYAAFNDEEGNICVFDVFMMNISSPIHRHDGKIIGIFHSYSLESIVAICENGTAIFIPHL
ncbi:hypothetical protein TRFO_37256 [Tritrichomonas foetus]|uniref:Uncharacterized protein n=1 Tax=Tritrichomonas foetus TaxID=1144522 RepID=A0A1J4JE60_9EUKA|nr:hypothetical protein TRFO_37256 [Tritrichomonas foetus]|eukprot:OHS96575.1 hypothetical protein TRFO_37256 [Tritrichomonas foetus]